MAGAFFQMRQLEPLLLLRDSGLWNYPALISEGTGKSDGCTLCCHDSPNEGGRTLVLHSSAVMVITEPSTCAVIEYGICDIGRVSISGRTPRISWERIMTLREANRSRFASWEWCHTLYDQLPSLF